MTGDRIVYDEDVLAVLRDAGSSLGIREVAERLGTRVRHIGSLVTRMEGRGLIEVEHPCTGYRGGQRVLRIPGGAA